MKLALTLTKQLLRPGLLGSLRLRRVVGVVVVRIESPPWRMRIFPHDGMIVGRCLTTTFFLPPIKRTK